MAYLSPTIAANRASNDASGDDDDLSSIGDPPPISRDNSRGNHGAFAGRGAAARASLSLIASPRPSAGIGTTAITLAPHASSARKCENRLAAASMRSPRAERLSTFSTALLP